MWEEKIKNLVNSPIIILKEAIDLDKTQDSILTIFIFILIMPFLQKQV